MRSKITIMNQALALSGQAGKEITEASTGPEFALMQRWYPEIVAEAFETGDQHFGKVRLALTNRSDGDFGFDDKWLLPVDVLHIINIRVDDYDTYDWERNGDYLYLNAGSGVEVTYIQAGQEHRWTAAFTNGIARKLEALLRYSINEEYQEAKDADAAGEAKLLKAGLQSSKQRQQRRPFKEGFLMRTRRLGRQRFRTRGST